MNAVHICGTLDLKALEESADCVPEIESVGVKGGRLLLTGYLAKPGRLTGKVEVRIGLVRDDTVLLLNTEMIRRSDIAQKLDCEDYCGEAAAVRISALSDGDYAIVFVDGGKELIRTGDTLSVHGGNAEWKKA